MYLIFDTETTGLPRSYTAPISDTNNWPRCVQIAWQLHDKFGKIIEHNNFLIYPENFNIPYEAEQLHGISTTLAQEKGIPLKEALLEFNQALKKATFIVGQNVGFDINIIGCEFYREKIPNNLSQIPILDTCTETTAQLLKLPGGRGGKFKLPTLSELHYFLFEENFNEAHNATADVEATTRCFFELIRTNVFNAEELKETTEYLVEFKQKNPEKIKPLGLKHLNLKQESEKLSKKSSENKEVNTAQFQNENIDVSNLTFSHLHNHTQFSVLQSTISVKDLANAAYENKMPAVAITDHANMMGAFQFVNAIANVNDKISANNLNAKENNLPEQDLIKAIIGCEFYVCENHLDKSKKDNGYQIVLLAKNKNGYHNLAKLSSIAYTKGFYYVPRIDKGLIEQYKEDIIVLSGNLYGEIANKILNVGENQAEEALLWWKNAFNDDFYIEIMRHNQEDEERVNPVLIKFAKKHHIKIVATNNIYYINKEDANAHDILLCVKDAEKQSTPIGRGRGYRYGLPNQEYYFKSSDQMKMVFADIPEAILNTKEIVDKIEPFSLSRKVLLPKFEIPTFFINTDKSDDANEVENNYLKHLTYEGAKKRYENLSEEIKERIEFELEIIKKTGYPGYFLIVQDFISAARNMGVSVGPGRGSAAGSVVAYCLGITNIDPLKYDLLFERFLNPDRVSLPDIDIDFDDEGRSLVMNYVIEKYGSNQVAQIITYGSMAAKSSIRDTARVLDLPLFEADKIAKLIPNIDLASIFNLPEEKLKAKLRNDELDRVRTLKELSEANDLKAQTINQAIRLEGSLRNTGIHACGVIITPEDITNFVPIATAKDSELNVTQFDNSVVESAGLLKMDFLGLKTLTLIKDTIKLIKYRHNITLNPDEFPIDDIKTYELFQRGETVGIFQYESVGMQKYLKELKPTTFADLIAMNALYRPGPLEYIPSFIKRKNGEEPIAYDFEACEEYLKETYGITVYQEQVMLLSQKLASFTKGDADVLRKAMGKKDRPVLDKMKPKFISQAKENGFEEKTLEKIWKDWEAFASYAFNKSHSTCYAWVAYQTAYLKAHYPAEYMAAVLSNNMHDIKQVTFFMEECRRMGLLVLGPDVNESYYKFTVNEQNAIRFGIGAVKGVGEAAVNTIVENRKDGKYKSVFDLAKRIDLRAANKKAFDNLVCAGALDGFKETHRAQYFFTEADGITFLEKVLRFAAKYQENKNSAQVSLFGESSDVQIAEPIIPQCEEWHTMEKLSKEKEVVGIYISGHPLDDYKHEIKHFCSHSLEQLKDLTVLVGKNGSVGGIITSIEHRTSKNGKGWAIFTLEGYDEQIELRIYNEDYLKFRHFLIPNNFVFIRFSVKDGWINAEGKKTDPRFQFLSVQYLQDVLTNFAKKLVLQMAINDINIDLVKDLQTLFSKEKGDNTLQFEILETEKTRKEIPVLYNLNDEVTENTDEELNEIMQEISEIEEITIITKLTLSSRKMKIKITNTLLDQLQKMNVSFKLN